MTQRPVFYPLAGGLDETTQALAVPKGRCISCRNYESVDRGYQRFIGFERIDGRPSPSKAFDTATGDPAAAREAARALITAVPGSGPVRGVATFSGVLYAWRDTGGGTGAMWKATAAGWTLVSAAFPAGGRYLAVNHNFYGASNLKRMYAVNGVGQAFDFDGTTITFLVTGMADDRPNRIAAFKQQLFLAFPGGSVQHSQVGEPRSYDAVLGAGEIAVGSDVTDFVVTTNALHIFAVDSVQTLIGNDEQDWVLEPLTVDDAGEDGGLGAVAFTAAKVGTPIYLDAGGFRSVQATQAFGNFRKGSIVPQINRTLGNKRRAGILPVAVVVSKAKDQYRLFFSDGTGISLYFGRKYPEPMLFDTGDKVVSCTCTEASPIFGERSFFGATDGFVYELDVGTSFDGSEITSFIQLPYDHEGSPWALKRWHKAIIEIEASVNTQIGLTAEFDYSDGDQGTLPSQPMGAFSGGGLWDVATWDDFFWSTPVAGQAQCYLDGQGANMSIIIGSVSAEQGGHTLQGITKMVSVRGQKR